MSFLTAHAMSEDEIRRAAPSVFAVTAHESRSERFRPIPTIEILKPLQREGFSVVQARQSRTRDASRRDFTTHFLRLRRLDDAAKYTVGGTVFEICLKNANDGSAAYDVMAGLWRILCLNGMVCPTSTIDTQKVRHSGDVASKVIDATYTVLKDADVALRAPSEWPQITMNREEREIFADAAHVLRFADAEGNVTTPIKPQQLLTPRRREDTNPDLWSVFNVVQENMIRGGLTARNAPSADNRRGRRVTTHEIKGIDQDVRLNRALWVLADRMSQLRRAA